MTVSTETSSPVRSLTELIAVRAHDDAKKVAIYASDGLTGDTLQPLTYLQLLRAVDRLCYHYSRLGLTLVNFCEQRSPMTKGEYVIAVLTPSGVDLILLELALCKLGASPLLISLNNSTEAVAHLCRTTSATHLIYHTSRVPTALEVQEILRNDKYKIQLIEERRFTLWGADGVDQERWNTPPFSPVLQPEDEETRIAVILHSSGSTGFPKPVYTSHCRLLANLGHSVAQAGLSTLPLYHGFGFFSTLRLVYNAVPVVLFPPSLPLTAHNICEVVSSAPIKCAQLLAVPYVVKLLAETKEGIAVLRTFNIVNFAGAALPDDLGDRLTEAGVNLVSSYSSTETGNLLNSHRDFAIDKAWNWLRPSPAAIPYLLFEPAGIDADNASVLELVVKDGYPSKNESNRPDGSYATKDLFIRHPNKQNWFKYVGRLDDTIVLVSGEKTNPLPMELTIRGETPYVAEAIVFGSGRPHVGCLLLPSEAGKDLAQSREAYLHAVWPAIERANAAAPSHSRIVRDMIEILPYGTEVPVATKLTILRPACYAKFKHVIDAVYERFEAGVTDNIKLSLSKEELEDYLVNLVHQVIGRNKSQTPDLTIARTTDLFAFGMDSLQATQLRNFCQRDLQLNGRSLGQNFVFEHPSIEKMSAYIRSVQSGGQSSSEESEAAQCRLMEALVTKWTSEIDVKHITASDSTAVEQVSQFVVLTGATGSLGAHLLYRLVQSPSVAKVVCLSRAKSHAESLVRVKHSLERRKLALTEEEIESKIVSYASDLPEEKLGLSQQEYEEISARATAVIHNAWPVNFNLSLESYDSHIRGAVNLLSLCLRRNTSGDLARFYFCSSVSTCHRSSSAVIPEDFPSIPETASATGYARSKWVVEKICQYVQKAAEPTIIVGVLRLGQLVGDTEHGIWNETESWPLMFQSAYTIGALPRLEEKLSWLPVDVAAKSIIEIVTGSPAYPIGSQCAVYNVLNPTQVNWDTIVDGLKRAGVKFDVVSAADWIDKLEKSDQDARRNPAIKLLPFYKARLERENTGAMKLFSSEHARAVSPALRCCPHLAQSDVLKWINHWQETGFLGSEGSVRL